jgi:hypothetical protein
MKNTTRRERAWEERRSVTRYGANLVREAMQGIEKQRGAQTGCWWANWAIVAERRAGWRMVLLEGVSQRGESQA